MRVSVDQIQVLDLRSGLNVEVSYEENGIKGVWHKAIIMTTLEPRSGLREFGVRLLKDNFATPLHQLSQNVLVRPVPPNHLHARFGIKEGCLVDANHGDEWWTGTLVKEEEDDDKCLVFFDSPPDLILFERTYLRPHLDWIYSKWWVAPKSGSQLSRPLGEQSIFSCGTIVEVSSKVARMGTTWVPAIIVKEVEEEDTEKKYIVKFCKDLSLNCKAKKANITVDSQSVRPTPPTFCVVEYKLSECVEAFRDSKWHKGIVKRVISKKRYEVRLETIKLHLIFKDSELRPLMEWEDGTWKIRQSPLAQESGNMMAGSMMTNGNTSSNEFVSCETEEKAQGDASPNKVLQPMVNQKNGSENDSSEDKANSKDNKRKRKRDGQEDM